VSISQTPQDREALLYRRRRSLLCMVPPLFNTSPFSGDMISLESCRRAPRVALQMSVPITFSLVDSGFRLFDCSDIAEGETPNQNTCAHAATDAVESYATGSPIAVIGIECRWRTKDAWSPLNVRSIFVSSCLRGLHEARLRAAVASPWKAQLLELNWVQNGIQFTSVPLSFRKTARYTPAKRIHQ